MPFLGLALRAALIGIHANLADDYSELLRTIILQMHQHGRHRLDRPNKILTAFTSLQMVYQPYSINTKTLIDLADIFLIKNQISPRLAELWHDFSPFLALPWGYSTRFWPSFQENSIMIQFKRPLLMKLSKLMYCFA